MFEAWTIFTSSFQRAPWGWAMLAMLVAGYFKLKPLMTRLNNEREANLLKERAAEMASMRDEMKELKAETERRVKELEAETEKQVNDLQARLELAAEELRVVRHDLANANQSLDMFIALIEANPERAAEHAKRVKAQREEARKLVQEEKAALQKMRVATIGKA